MKHVVTHTTASPWLETQLPQFPALEGELKMDVVVIGAGITGLTTAWLLREAGVHVAVVERHRIGAADSGHTTAHLTYVTDTRLHELAKQFGEDGARAAWEGGAAAIDQIETIIRTLDDDCGFRRVCGYLHGALGRKGAADSPQDEKARLQRDAELGQRLGFDSHYVERMPYGAVPAVEFEDQAAFDPGRYLAALARQLTQKGCRIFEQSPVDSVEDQPRRVVTAQGHIDCSYVVLATHNPLMGTQGAVRSGLFQTKLALYTSYALGARLPANTLPDALFWDTANPYDYLRIEPRDDYQLAIFGGADTKTGQQDDAAAFHELERRLFQRVPGAAITHRWLGQVIETDDGLPYIGERSEGEFVATGFSGNGYTFGTLAAMMARDAFLKRSNPWQELLRPDRKPFHGGAWQYVRENLDYPWYLLRSRLGRAEGKSLEEVPHGEGRILALKEGRCAVYRAPDGALSVCSAVCTHLKCLVRWNGADKTWDCPCHGSRFSTDGDVLSGPAEEPLERIPYAQQ
jgi:glycine/D-amino acid oxidase-like deaminating enzyme/nitrite reductase/ring-hydroxylating ferredoxin subunit